MSTIYLHVGPHKTGSTYLQHIFAKQAKALESQGILYPSVGREYLTGHHNIAWLFAGFRLINTDRAKLMDGLSRLAGEEKMNLLFSSEEFCKIPDESMNNLRRVFPDQDFHILYFLRRGAALILSLWRENINHGYTTPLDQISRTLMTEIRHYDLFDHDGTIARYKRALEGTISVFDYDELVRSTTDLTYPISETIGVELKSRNQKINASLAAEYVELIRAANLYSAKIGRGRHALPRIVCQRMLRIPILNSILTNHIRAKFISLHQSLPAKRFLEMGFQGSHFLDGDIDISYDYIPGSVLLDKLNQDNFWPWRIIKKMIRER